MLKAVSIPVARSFVQEVNGVRFGSLGLDGELARVSGSAFALKHINRSGDQSHGFSPQVFFSKEQITALRV